MKTKWNSQNNERKANQMNKKNVTLGWAMIVIGIVVFIVVSLLTGDSDNATIRMLSPLSTGVLVTCLLIGIGMIRRGKSEKASRNYEVEQHDERNIAIRGKAAYIAFVLTLVLGVMFSAYIFYIQEDMTTGLIGYGICSLGILSYFLSNQIIRKNY